MQWEVAEKKWKNKGKVVELDWVGHIDNIPSTDKLNHFEKKKKRKKSDV